METSQLASVDGPTGHGEELELSKEGENDGNIGIWIGAVILAAILAAAGYFLLNRNIRSKTKEE